MWTWLPCGPEVHGRTADDYCEWVSVCKTWSWLSSWDNSNMLGLIGCLVHIRLNGRLVRFGLIDGFVYICLISLFLALSLEHLLFCFPHSLHFFLSFFQFVLILPSHNPPLPFGRAMLRQATSSERRSFSGIKKTQRPLSTGPGIISQNRSKVN